MSTHRKTPPETTSPDTTSPPAVVPDSPPKPKKRRTKMLASGMDVARVPAESRRQAAVVLEVLAGLRSPDEAAEALGVSAPTYYNLETRALRGLVHGCTPEPPGRKMALEKRLREMASEKRGLEQQVQRYRALLRSTQRAGEMLVEPPRTKRKSGSKTTGTAKVRKPRVRALRAIEALTTEPSR